MRRVYPNAHEVRINEKLTPTDTQNWLKLGEEKAVVLERYLLRLVQSFYFYTEVLLDFLCIDEKYKKLLREMNKRRVSIFSETLTESLQPDRSDRQFFIVKYSNNKISIDNSQILSLNMDRNVKEIEELHERLLTSQKLKSPLLIEKTDQEILSFIDKIANSKVYWNEFSAWIDLNQSMRIHIYNLFDDWYDGFTTTKVDVIGH